MTETYAPAVRVVVVASLLFAIATMTAVTFSVARAAGALAVGACGAYGEAYDYDSLPAARESALAKCQSDACRVVTTSKRSCAAFAVDFANPCGAYGTGGNRRQARRHTERGAGGLLPRGRQGVRHPHVFSATREADSARAAGADCRLRS